MLPHLCASFAGCVYFQGQDQGGVVDSGLQAIRAAVKFRHSL